MSSKSNQTSSWSEKSPLQTMKHTVTGLKPLSHKSVALSHKAGRAAVQHRALVSGVWSLNLKAHWL